MPRRPIVSALVVLLGLFTSLGPLQASVLGRGGRGGPVQRRGLSAPAPRVEKPIPIQLGAHLTSEDLARIAVGNQAGILKIVSADGARVLFIKDAPNVSMRGIDGVAWAPLNNAHRRAILEALVIGDDEVDAITCAMLDHFGRLYPREAVALLGALGSIPDRRMSRPTQGRLRGFLASLLERSTDVRVHRLAVLSLALVNQVDEATVSHVIDFMSASHNAWETFTTQQFFAYHRGFIHASPRGPEMLRRIEASGNPYVPDILAVLR